MIIKTNTFISIKELFNQALNISSSKTFTVIFLILLAGIIEPIGLVGLLSTISVLIEQTGTISTNPIINNFFLSYPSLLNIEILLLFLVCIGFLKTALLFICGSSITKFHYFISKYLRNSLIENLFRANWLYISKQSSGLVTAKLIAEAHRSSTSFNAIFHIIQTLIFSFIFIIFGLFLNWKFTIIVTITGIIILIFLQIIVNLSRKYGVKETIYTRKLLESCNEDFSNLKTFKAMGLTSRLIIQLKKKIYGLYNSQAQIAILSLLRTLIAEPMFLSFLIVIFYFFIIPMKIPISEVTVLFLIFVRISMLLTKLQTYVQKIAVTENAYWNLKNDIDRSKKFKESYHGTKTISYKKTIRFSNVYFNHKRKEVLKNLNLEIPFNKITLIQGASGIGKTTIIDLIAGLYKPEKGNIFADNINLNDIKFSFWRKNIGYVSQDPSFISGNLNKFLNDESQKINKKKLIDIFKYFNMEQFINLLSKGIETDIKQFGSKLSGGQTQRIEIIRTLLRSPKILILDEATSALDFKNENNVIDYIKKYLKKVTIIVISHRKSFEKISHKIYKIKTGGINKIK